MFPLRLEQWRADLAQWTPRRTRLSSASGLALALAFASPARAESGYVGDFALGAAPDYANSGATVWDGTHTYSHISNPAGASILNQGDATGQVTANGGVIRNAPAATWTGDLDLGANVPGADVVNEGKWTGALNNAGGAIDNSGAASSVNNAAGVFTNEGTVSGGLVNAGQAANAGAIAGGVVNSSQFVNNAAGSVAGGLADSGSTTNNGAIAGGVAETGAFTNNASGRVSGGFALVGGGAVNNGEVDGGVSVGAGAFVNNGVTKGGAAVTGAQATLTDNGVIDGKATVSAGSLVVNAAGVVAGNVANAGSVNNAGAIQGSVANAGAFVNAGTVAGAVRQTGGDTTNNGAIAGAAHILSGAAVNNGAIGGDVKVGATASLIDNGALGGTTVNQGALTVNATGDLKGPLFNQGVATIDGLVEGGAVNRGEMVVNASGRVDKGLTTNGGSTTNAGLVTGGAVVNSGLLTTSGEIDGGLRDAGLVKATGVISGSIAITGQLVIGNGTADGSRLTLAPGSSVNGAITVPVNFTTGQSNFLVAKGADLTAARLDLTGTFVNPNGAYWGSLSLSDSPIALSDSAKQALTAASGPLYAYSDPDGTGIVQTINPGLGVTAAQVAIAASVAFADALGEAPADFERAPANPTPNLGMGSVWSRGFGAALTLSGENNAGSGPTFDATRLSTHLGGGEIGVEYGLHNLQNSGFSLRFGIGGGDAAASVSDSAGSGASGIVNIPFVGAYAALSGNGVTTTFDARYVSLDMRLTDAPLAVFGQAQHAGGMSYGAQTSFHIPLGAFFLEPEGGVRVANLAIGDQTTNVGDLSFGKTRITLGHAGLKFGGDFASGALAWRPYVLASVWHEWQHGATIEAPQGPTIVPTGLSGFEQVGLGLSATLAHTGLSGFSQAQWALGTKISGLAATGGLRFDF